MGRGNVLWVLSHGVKFRHKLHSGISESFDPVLLQCVVDLGPKNCLILGSTGTETKFLDEKDMPECSRLVNPNELTDLKKELDELKEAIAISKQSAGAFRGFIITV